MILWIDAQLSPALAPWIRETFGFEAQAVRDRKLREILEGNLLQAVELLARGEIIVEIRDRR